MRYLPFPLGNSNVGKDLIRCTVIKPKGYGNINYATTHFNVKMRLWRLEAHTVTSSQILTKLISS